MALSHTPQGSDNPVRPRRTYFVPQAPVAEYTHPFGAKAPPPALEYSYDLSRPPVAPSADRRLRLPRLFVQHLQIFTLLALGTLFLFNLTLLITEPVDAGEAAPAPLANLEGIPEIGATETPEAYLDRISISGVRLAQEQTSLVIDGYIYRVGDVVNESVGIRFVGHDPDGEYLIFEDAAGVPHLLPLPGTPQPKGV